jgi:hypothetical protein
VPIILIGLRYKVGTDYPTYARLFKHLSHLDLRSALTQTDVGYAALNWTVSYVGGGFWLVNLVCSALFTYGLVQYAKGEPNPWLVIVVGVPYLVIVVGMGYSRQAVAIALIMVGLTAISRGSLAKFVLWTLAAALFHRTAVMMIPVVALSYTRNRAQAIAIGAIGCLIGYYIFQTGQGFDRYEQSYIGHTLQSEGARIRLAMNLPPAVIFLLMSRRFGVSEPERILWRNLSIIAVLSFVSLYYVKSSTALDRIALYIIPLQLFVLGRVPYILAKGGSPRLLVSLVILYAAAVQFTWLNYSINARNWIPYQFYHFGR